MIEDRAGSVRGVSFDFGQTMVRFDAELCASKVLRFGIRVEASAVEQAVPLGFVAADYAVRAGKNHPLAEFLTEVLAVAGARDDGNRQRAVAYLVADQPRQNLFRKPIEGMVALCEDLRSQGVPIGVLSNSEGALVQLVDEVGMGHLFSAVGDSGVTGFEKPDRRAFEWISQALDTPLDALVHVGDSRTADVEGALRVGATPIWFGADAAFAARAPGFTLAGFVAQNAIELRAVLARLGLLNPSRP